MLLAPIPWAARTWALPFLTALAPSERYCRERGQRHKKLTDWARQMMLQVRRWLPARELVLVADMGFAALDLLAALSRRGVICITRLRLDAALYEPASRRRPGTKGRPRTKGARLPNLSDVLRGRARAGAASRCRAGMAKEIAWSSSARPRPCGAMAECPSCRSAGSCCVILSVGSRRRPCCAPILARSAADHPLVHPALAGRGHLPGSSRPSGRRDPAAMVGSAVARTTPCLFGLFSIVTLLAGNSISAPEPTV